MRFLLMPYEYAGSYNFLQKSPAMPNAQFPIGIFQSYTIAASFIPLQLSLVVP